MRSQRCPRGFLTRVVVVVVERVQGLPARRRRVGVLTSLAALEVLVVLPLFHLSVLLAQVGGTAQPTRPDTVNWPAIDRLLEIDSDLGFAFGLGKFDVPPPTIWPAPLNALWEEGNAECAIISLASTTAPTSTRCCGIRLSHALRRRLTRWRDGGKQIDGLHEGAQPLSTVLVQSPLLPAPPKEPFKLQTTCAALPSALTLSSSDAFSQALVERWASVGGTAPARNCTLRTLAHVEPKESATLPGGEKVASTILDCGQTIAVDEVAMNPQLGGAGVSVDRLLRSFATAVCKGTPPPKKPAAPVELPQSAIPTRIFGPFGSVPAKLELPSACAGLPTSLRLEGSARLNDALTKRWADAQGTGPEASCTTSESFRSEILPALPGEPIDVVRTVLQCGDIVLAADAIRVGTGGRDSVDDLLHRYAAARCAELERAAAAAAPPPKVNEKPSAPKAKGKKRP